MIQKKQCVKFNKTFSNNNAFEVEITKSQQTMSVFSISGLTQVSDYAEAALMNRSSKSRMQMQHRIQIEKIATISI